jgi:hypothetical protein
MEVQRVGRRVLVVVACLAQRSADPASEDPIARESTRLWCTGGVDPQTSLDPQQMREWIPAVTYGAHAFGVKPPRGGSKAEAFELMLARRTELLPWITEYSQADSRPAWFRSLVRYRE